MDPRNPAIDGVPSSHREPLPIDVPVFDFVQEPERRLDGPAIVAPAVVASVAALTIVTALVLWSGKLAWGFLQ